MKPWDPRRFAGIILALALALGLAACSAIKLGYSSLPDVVYWWLDGYADFTDDQDPTVRAELARLHAWHRQQELPRMVELLGRIERLAPGEISAAQACAVVTDVQGRLQAVWQAAEGPAAALAVSLRPEQLRHIERKLRSSNDKFRREWVDMPLAQQQEKRYEAMLKRLESIYGSLDEPQRSVLRQGIARSAYDPARILADRQRRQQDLLVVLRRLAGQDVPPAEARAQLHAWMDRSQNAPDTGYRTWQQGLVDEGCRIYSEVHRSTTAAQREQAVRRLRAYQRDLRELASAQ